MCERAQRKPPQARRPRRQHRADTTSLAFRALSQIGKCDHLSNWIEPLTVFLAFRIPSLIEKNPYLESSQGFIQLRPVLCILSDIGYIFI